MYFRSTICMFSALTVLSVFLVICLVGLGLVVFFFWVLLTIVSYKEPGDDSRSEIYSIVDGLN